MTKDEIIDELMDWTNSLKHDELPETAEESMQLFIDKLDDMGVLAVDKDDDDYCGAV